MKNPPNFLFAFGILVFYFAVELLIAAAFYDAGMVYQYGDPRAFVIRVISSGIIITILMKYTVLNYSSLFHPSNSSVSSTVVLLFPPTFIVVLGAMWWLVDLIYFINLIVPEDRASIEMLTRMFSGGFVTIIAICLIAPFLEEMLFRGIILRGFLNHYSPQKAILLSSMLFALIHLNLYQIPIAFIMGCFLGWLYYHCRSLWPSIFAHALYNGGVYFQHVFGYYEFNSLMTNLVTFIISASGVLMLAYLLNIKWAKNS
jgi:membrane protease YdiL (CAAX protease family)